MDSALRLESDKNSPGFHDRNPGILGDTATAVTGKGHRKGIVPKVINLQTKVRMLPE